MIDISTDDITNGNATPAPETDWPRREEQETPKFYMPSESLPRWMTQGIQPKPTPKPLPAFKVGDEIELIKDIGAFTPLGYIMIPSGAKGTVTKTDSSTVEATFRGHPGEWYSMRDRADQFIRHVAPPSHPEIPDSSELRAQVERLTAENGALRSRVAELERKARTVYNADGTQRELAPEEAAISHLKWCAAALVANAHTVLDMSSELVAAHKRAAEPEAGR